MVTRGVRGHAVRAALTIFVALPLASSIGTAATTSSSGRAKHLLASATHRLHPGRLCSTRGHIRVRTCVSHRRGGRASAHVVTASTAPDCGIDPLTVNCAQLPLDFITTNDCMVPPPFVEIVGLYHVVAQTTANANGTTTTKAYTNYQQSHGFTVLPLPTFDPTDPSTVTPANFTRQPTATQYQANLTDREYTRTDPTNTAIDESFSETYELISNSPDPNMLVMFSFRLRVDAHGVPTVTIDGFGAKCTG
jgi:hypothetical protein